MIEILSPAGNYESFIAAVQNGADAIYMGIDKFNARKMAKNFTIEEYIEAIKYAHLRGVRIYLTLNVLLNDDEVKEAIEILIKLYSSGLDAVIIQDIGLIDIIKKVLPNLDIHISTQMTVHNLSQIKVLESLGVSRVVLARELSIEEIKYICDNTNLEIEVFVHGALCMSYSGACLMSSMIGTRSGNKGACLATCRMKYTLSKNNEKVKYGHLLSKKDIYGLEHVEKLINIGVHSLKIEGRGKTLEYVGLVTDKYKKAVSNVVNEKNNIDEKELLQMFSREGKSYGYFEGIGRAESISINTPKNTGLYLGNVLSIKDKFVKIKLEEQINLHDGIEIFDEDKKVVYSNIITCIRDEKFNIKNSICFKDEIVYIGDINTKLNNKSKLYINKTSSKELNTRYIKKSQENLRKVIVPIEVNILKDSNIQINVMNETIQFDYIPQTAIKKQIDYMYVEEALCKSGDTPFDFEIIDFNIDENLFIPVSKLNELRRFIQDYLIDKNNINLNVDENYKLLKEYDFNKNKELNNLNNNIIKPNGIYVYKYNKDTDYNKYNENNIYLEISDIVNDESILLQFKMNIYICIPTIVHSNLNEYIVNNLERIVSEYKIKGIVIGNFGYVPLCNKIKQLNKEIILIADYSLNIVNTYSAQYYKNNNIDIVTLSNEIDEYMIDKIKKIINIQLIDNYITVMTTRFCLISSFTNNCNCNNKDLYTLKDDLGAVYYIITDKTDCITKLVKQYNNDSNIIKYKNEVSIRKNSLFG